MAIQFCDDCGDTLPISAQKLVTCDCCGKENKNTILNVVIQQKCTDFPSPLRSKLRDTTQQVTAQDRLNTRAMIQKECPKCHSPQVSYVELQLRSADEGSTIVYTCIKCNNKFQENN